ncbi:MAG: glycosyltransferase [Patescibacteria group bacterium]
MKIVTISTYAPRGTKHANAGGVASYTKNLVTNLPKDLGDELIVLCNKIDGKFESYDEDGLKIIRCFDKNIKCFFELFTQIQKIKPDVIHIHQELSLYGGILNAYLLQWFLLFLRRYKTIITLHGVVSLKQIDREFIKGNNSNLPVWLTKLAFYVIYRPLCVWSKMIIVHEEYFKNILIHEYKVKGDKIIVIHHGVEDLQTIDQNEARLILSIDKDKDVCLFMGYLTGYKGIDFLIEGFAEYSKLNPKAYLIIGAGKHPKLENDRVYLNEYQRLVNKAQTLIPQDMYRWVGFIKEEDIINYYSACDVVLFPYTAAISSSGPMAIAIAYRKPILCSDVFSQVFDEKLLYKRDRFMIAKALYDYFLKNKSNILDYIYHLKEERTWKSICQITNRYYKKH